MMNRNPCRFEIPTSEHHHRKVTQTAPWTYLRSSSVWQFKDEEQETYSETSKVALRNRSENLHREFPSTRKSFNKSLKILVLTEIWNSINFITNLQFREQIMLVLKFGYEISLMFPKRFPSSATSTTCVFMIWFLWRTIFKLSYRNSKIHFISCLFRDLNMVSGKFESNFINFWIFPIASNVERALTSFAWFSLYLRRLQCLFFPSQSSYKILFFLS